MRLFFRLCLCVIALLNMKSAYCAYREDAIFCLMDESQKKYLRILPPENFKKIDHKKDQAAYIPQDQEQSLYYQIFHVKTHKIRPEGPHTRCQFSNFLDSIAERYENYKLLKRADSHDTTPIRASAAIVIYTEQNIQKIEGLFMTEGPNAGVLTRYTVNINNDTTYKIGIDLIKKMITKPNIIIGHVEAS